MKVNDVITLDINDLSFDAMGIGELDGEKIFVTNALPGEKIKAKIVQLKHNYAVGRVEEILKRSPERNNGENDQWAKDGFDNLANLKYEYQLQFKRDRIKNQLEQAGLSSIKVNDTVPSPKQTAYRNQRLVYVRNYHGQLEFGFLKPYTHEFEPISNFLTTDETVSKVLFGIRDVLREMKIPAYDPKTNRGFIRNVDVRRSNKTGKIMIILVTREKDRTDLPKLYALLTEKMHNINGISMNYNPHQTEKVWGKIDTLLWGVDYLTEEINGLKFQISPQSYFQFNSLQAPVVRDLAIKEADIQPDDLVVDAYSGVGTISLLAAQKAKEVGGIEAVVASVRDARENAKINKIGNAKFFKGNADQVLARWNKQGLKPNIVFVDPPKNGISKGFINTVAQMGVKKLFYVSANPATLVRDIKEASKYGYRCDQITPVDLAPQKSEIKSVTLLQLQ